MILDCLRHWVSEMHVDGFRFDLASVLRATRRLADGSTHRSSGTSSPIRSLPTSR